MGHLARPGALFTTKGSDRGSLPWAPGGCASAWRSVGSTRSPHKAPEIGTNTHRHDEQASRWTGRPPNRGDRLSADRGRPGGSARPDWSEGTATSSHRSSRVDHRRGLNEERLPKEPHLRAKIPCLACGFVPSARGLATSESTFVVSERAMRPRRLSDLRFLDATAGGDFCSEAALAHVR